MGVLIGATGAELVLEALHQATILVALPFVPVTLPLTVALLNDMPADPGHRGQTTATRPAS